MDFTKKRWIHVNGYPDCLFQFLYLNEPKQFYALTFSIGGGRRYIVSPLSVYPLHIYLFVMLTMVPGRGICVTLTPF